LRAANNRLFEDSKWWYFTVCNCWPCLLHWRCY